MIIPAEVSLTRLSISLASNDLFFQVFVRSTLGNGCLCLGTVLCKSSAYRQHSRTEPAQEILSSLRTRYVLQNYLRKRHACSLYRRSPQSAGETAALPVAHRAQIADNFRFLKGFYSRLTEVHRRISLSGLH